MKNELTKEEYQKRINRCKKLGAEWFQEIVFKVENLKFKVLKKYFPNCTERYDKKCDRKCKKELKKAKSEEERKLIIFHYRELKMLFRKEINTEQNRNYHLDKKRPSDTLRYLEWNKKVHQKGLLIDLIALPILTGVALAGFPVAIPFIVSEALSAFINFECINIQDYNIYRFKQKKVVLEKIEERQQRKSQEEYGEAAKVITSVMNEKEKTNNPTEIPNPDEVISRMNKEQLIQFKNMLKKEQQKREQISQAKKGGYKNGN